jgi:hypothetical protein
MLPKSYECRECANEIDAVTRPKRCPACDEEGTLVRSDGFDSRERDEDDGCGGYSDPRDYRAGRE